LAVVLFAGVENKKLLVRLPRLVGLL